MDEEANAQGPVEMVTVPALGAEWGKDELKDMTKRGRREKDKEDFGRSGRCSTVDNTGCLVANGSPAVRSCSPSLGSVPRTSYFLSAHWITVGQPALSSVGIVLAFTIPRVPSFSINGQTPLVSATGWFNQSIPAEFSRSPPTSPSRVMYHFRSTPARISYRSLSNTWMRRCTTSTHSTSSDMGHLNHTTLPANHFSPYRCPSTLHMWRTNDSDQTCQSCAFFYRSFSRI
jgi:hypothetical protein